MLKTALGAQIRVLCDSPLSRWWLLLLLYFLWIICFKGCHTLFDSGGTTEFLCWHFHKSLGRHLECLDVVHLSKWLCDILRSLQGRRRKHTPEGHFHTAWVETCFHLVLSAGCRGSAETQWPAQGIVRVPLLLWSHGMARGTWMLVSVSGWACIEGFELRELAGGIWWLIHIHLLVESVAKCLMLHLKQLIMEIGRQNSIRRALFDLDSLSTCCTFSPWTHLADYLMNYLNWAYLWWGVRPWSSQWTVAVYH